MVEGLYEEESKAIEKFLVSQEKFESVKINDSLLMKGQLESLDFTHIWIHQLSGNHGGNFKEILKLIKLAKDAGAKELAVLHCTSVYPCEDKLVNLNAIETMEKSLMVLQL